MSDTKVLRVAATSDIHYSKGTHGLMEELFVEASKAADVLLICGDLTDYGYPEEAEVLAEDLRKFVKIPVLAVL
ncbi:MAG TPA: metallophosphoesterase family protein, partial [Chthoniobacteraceae bacterium]